jgi:hypothetical protein
MGTGFCLESREERVLYEDLDIAGEILLKWIVEKYIRVIRTGLI